jgi:hypothetical protein
MKKKNVILLAAFVFLISNVKVQAQNFKKIFNGKDLSGWLVPQPNNDNWVVKGKELIVTSSEDRKGSNLWTEKSYKNFVFEAEYQNISGVVDSGIFLRSDKDQIQIGISGSLKRDLTGSPYIPGKGYPKEAKLGNSLNDKGWNTLKIQVVGNTYVVWLNGVAVNSYTSETIPEEGPIGIQLHPGNVMSIKYRNIKLAEL